MSLGSGARLGPYDVLAPLGAGGMGEVYRAGYRLKRDVALKVLPEAFASDPEPMARFHREPGVYFRQLGSKVELPEKGMRWTQLDELS
jgi:serine/threonine protein kinase